MADDLNELVRPFYRAADLATWKWVSESEVDQLTEARHLLMLTSASGTSVYPTWQFGPNGELLPHLADVLTLIDPDDGQALGSALWLNRPAGRFDGLTPAEKLRAGAAAEVLVAAHQIDGW